MRVLLGLFVSLSGCVHSGVNAVPGPNGEMVYEAYCNGNHATYGDCMREAANTCHGKYHIMSRDSSNRLIPLGDGDHVSRAERQMVFECGEAD